MKYFWILPMSTVLVLIGACRGRDQDYRPVATISDVMHAMVMPSANALWQSVATVQTATSVEEKQPRTDEEWDEVHHQALILLEATNLLLIPGRRVADASERERDSSIELEPAQIQKLITDNRQAWNDLAHNLHDAVLPAHRAIEAKNPDALFEVGGVIEQACESCHMKYWYPNSKNGSGSAAR